MEADQWVKQKLEQALLDDLYYTRQAALKGLEDLGNPQSAAVKNLAAILQKGNLKNKIKAARCLSEIGSPAQSALSDILHVLRDAKADQKLRLWCLRAAWWTDESVLRPEDWVLGLHLEPGEIHRHLLNRAMDRLQKAGPEAIPALNTLLTSPDPQVRSRVATLLRKTGEEGITGLEKLRNDPVWYVRAAAGFDVPLPKEQHSAVKVAQDGNKVSFTNGLIKIEFDMSGQDPGPFSARITGGKNMIDSDWLYKILSFKDTKAQSIIERVWFQKIHGVPLNKTLQWELGESTDDQAEMVCRYPGGEDFPLEWEFHYVLRRGDRGFYSYMIVRNVTGKELPGSTTTSGANSIGMINQLVAPTRDMFDTAVLHDNFKWPANFHNGTDFSLYPDIYQASYRMPDGEVDAKHEGSNKELNSPATGYTGPHGGFWQILPSLEFCGSFWPWNQRTSVNHNMFVLALENKYYIPTAVRITDDWKKLYGPIFYYLNQGENTEEMWNDAKRQASMQVNDWPYRWLDEQDYHKRGTVTGQLQLSSKKSPSGAWALLALPGEIIPESIEFGEWWRDVGAYHYVAKIKDDGSFFIPKVRSGNYDLFIWHEGIYGEFKKNGLFVRDGENLDVGKCILIPRDNGHLLWQLGEPNRTVTEFKNGGNFHQWDTYLRYQSDFPHGMNFKIGKSDPQKDWNYLQPAIIQGEEEPTSAGITFEFDASIPGDPLLTVVAGGRSVSMDILINGKKIGDLKITRIGLQHIRTVPFGELTVHKYPFDRSLLQTGANQLTLRFAGAGEATEETKQWNYPKWTSYIAYDFIRLEMVE
jgi:rhamnogalacturonan endolyase